MESNSDGNLLAEAVLPQPSGALESLLDERITHHDDLHYIKVNGESSSRLDHNVEDELDVDIVGCPEASGRPTAPVLGDDTDTAECSSSFGGTSDSDEAQEHETCDMEASLTFNGENSDSTSSGRAFRVCRRKKLTIHWQRYIRAVKWRCNWLELRMNELRTRNMKRKQHLLAAEMAKSTHLAAFPCADSAARTVPLSIARSSGAMKRRRRKRIEESMDLSAFMACHNVFSLLEKGMEADGLSLDDGPPDNGLADANGRGHDALAIDHDWPAMDPGESVDSIELLLLQIETIQARVVKLRTELDQGVDWKAGQAALTACAPATVAPPADMATSPGRSHSGSPGCNGGAPVAEPAGSPPTYLSEYDTEDLGLSEGAVSSFGDATPNIMESTANLLSADQSARIDVGDEILISNRAAKEELEDFEKVGRVLERVVEGARVSGSETGSETERTVSEEPVVMRRCSEAATVTYVRRSKRPRTERRLSPSSWHCEKIGRRRSTKTRDHS